MSVADLLQGAKDDMGNDILTLYGRKAPSYAVYRTKERVLVQYADDRDEAAGQRSMMAPLNPPRGEINGWMDGWRKSKDEATKEKADRYDRRVADALIVAFEGDAAGAQTLLAAVKQDILDERTALARFNYLATAFAFVALLMVLDRWLASTSMKQQPLEIWCGAGAGGLGAFFSIALALKGRTVLPDLYWRANGLDAVLRVTVGVIAGALLVGMSLEHLVQVQIGGTALDGSDWLKILLIGFVAGFSERLVQDLLGGVTVTAPKPASQPVAAAPNPAGPTKGGPQGAAQAAAAAAPPAAGPPDDEAVAESGIDACCDDHALTADELTDDSELPPAAGGVAGGLIP